MTNSRSANQQGRNRVQLSTNSPRKKLVKIRKGDAVNPAMQDVVKTTPEEEKHAIDNALQETGFTRVFSAQEINRRLARSKDAKPIIKFSHVGYSYGDSDEKVLEDVNLEIYPGECVLLVGPSGTGKTTLLSLLNRTLQATEGSIEIAGENIGELTHKEIPLLRRQIGTVFQDYKLIANKTVYENIAFVLRCLSKPQSVIDEQIPEILRLVGLSDKSDSYPHQLSGGEQQRAAIARAMVNKPPLLICDEPTGNLDPIISGGIIRLLERINKIGTTVVISTHDVQVVDSMRQRVIELKDGRIIRDENQGSFFK